MSFFNILVEHTEPLKNTLDFLSWLATYFNSDAVTKGIGLKFYALKITPFGSDRSISLRCYVAYYFIIIETVLWQSCLHNLITLRLVDDNDVRERLQIDVVHSYWHFSVIMKVKLIHTVLQKFETDTFNAQCFSFINL